MTTADIAASIMPYIKVVNEEEKSLFDQFIAQNVYVQGTYDSSNDFVRLAQAVISLEVNHERANRLFYLALPPTVFASVTQLIHDHCMTDR